MNTVDKQYQGFLRKLIMYGQEKEDRTGTGTLSYFGEQFRHDISKGFPLLTTKKMAIKSIMTELKWFLKGRTDLRYLLQNDCHIWTGDAYKVYERVHHWDLEEPEYGIKEFEQKILEDDGFSKQWGNLGFIYGKQWKDWDGTDQIKELIKNIKENPNSRRLMVSAWNVGELSLMKLPPCHYGFQCYVNDGKLSLMWNQRSVDTFLGLPFNIASYGVLLLLLCKETNLKPGELIGSLGDTHLYKNHLEQAHEQIKRDSFKLPTIRLDNVNVLEGEFDYEILNYESHSSIKAPLSN